jgi:hypothetical protein
MAESASDPLTLIALSDLSDSSRVNINIVTTLEKARVEYLVSQGMSFADAKEKASGEMLKIFSLNPAEPWLSEFLDITAPGDNDAILLAVSLIMQGYRTVPELAGLITDISSDIREDGVLNSVSIGSSLINHAIYLNTGTIRNTIESMYDGTGIAASIPDFEKYIELFIDSTHFIYTNLISYPDSGKYGINILSNSSETDISLESGDMYSMNAVVPDPIHITVTIQFHVDNTWAIDPTYSGWETEWIGGNTFLFRDDQSNNIPIFLSDYLIVVQQQLKYLKTIVRNHPGQKKFPG